MSAEPVTRTYAGAAVDKLAGLALGLSWEECHYTVTPVRIPTADGIHLAADLYQPAGLRAGAKPHGLILSISCYGRGFQHAILTCRIFAARGYAALIVSSRGTFGSEGEFIPVMTEKADSQDVVKWMREQPWYPGSFATFGPSYLGYTQWALLEDPPEDLKACAILCGPHNQPTHYWGPKGGLFRMDRIFWVSMVADQENPNAKGFQARRRELKTVYETVPLLPAVEKHLDGKAPYMREMMTTPDPDAPFWGPSKQTNALDKVNVPVLLGSGWYDTFTYQSFEQYQHLKKRGVKVYLTSGAWTHIHASGIHSMPEVFAFFDEHVAGRTKDHRPLPVKVYDTGTKKWLEYADWPPPTISHKMYYLKGEDKSIIDEPAPSRSPAISFTFDPTNPTPTLGGPLMTAEGGRADDSAYASRADVLAYTSGPMAKDIQIMGSPIVQLKHTTDWPDADLFVRLSEVDKKGVSHNICETYEVISPLWDGQTHRVLTLQPCAHTFKKGTRIRLIVAGGSFPLMARNPGTGELRTTAEVLKPVVHTIEHAEGTSQLALPILEAYPSS